MSGNDTAQTGQTTKNNQLPTTKADEKQNQFLQLLVAQLKGQNPLEPLDGTQFVTQLAQFSSLEELAGIHSTLRTMKVLMEPTEENSGTSTSQEKELF